MNASGNLLAKVASLMEDNEVKPGTDKVFSFEQMNEALAYVESGRAKGKVVIKAK